MAAMIRAAFLLLLFVFPSSLAGQDVPADDESEAWSGSAELGLIATSGNTESRSLSVGGEALYEASVWELRATARFIDVESEGEQTAESINALVHVDHDWNDRARLFGEASYLRNRFSGIESRYALATGVTYAVIDTDERKFKLSGGAGYTVEDRLASPDREFLTGVGGATFRHSFSERSFFENVTGLDLNLETIDDWRARNVAALVAGLTEVFSLKLAYDVRYQNEPVPGFEKTDTVTSAAIVASF